jgi:2-C-methyl-D-erythritol 2,4-cyclodiphosphate synthase
LARVRIGLGFDAHPFAAGRPLRLGGVEIAHDAGLSGHSDGDVLLHAVADAILGAAGLGSLGEHFPDSDPAWAGADSRRFVERAGILAAGRGFTVANIDAVVVGEAPRIAPHAGSIRRAIAGMLGIEESRVNVRGTSTNGMGFPGRKEGVAAMAVVLLLPKADR